MTRNLHPRRHRRAAFSLIELMAVVAIISVLSVLILPALGNTRARQLVTAGNMVVDLSQQARQNSMSRGVLTALVVIQNKKDDWNYRTFTLVELAPGATAWQPVLPWMQLPDGVMMDATQSSDFSASQPALPVALNLPARNGQPVSPGECACQIFSPSGGLLVSTTTATEPQVLRLVPGMPAGGKMAPATATGNYYDVIINRYTGLAKVDRP